MVMVHNHWETKHEVGAGDAKSKILLLLAVIPQSSGLHNRLFDTLCQQSGRINE